MKKYRTEREWTTLIEKQEKSGLSAIAFCKQLGIHPNLFYRKRSTLGNGHNEKSFIKLDIPNSTNQSLGNIQTLVKIGPIEIRPGQNSNQKQLREIFCSALEAVNAQL